MSPFDNQFNFTMKRRQLKRDRKEQRLLESGQNVKIPRLEEQKNELIKSVDPAQVREEKIQRRHQQKLLLYPDGILDKHGNPVPEHGQGKTKPHKDLEAKEIKEQERLEKRSRLQVKWEERGPKAAKTFNDFLLGIQGPVITHFQCHFEARKFKNCFDRVDIKKLIKENVKRFETPTQIYPDPLDYRRNTQSVYECQTLFVSNYDITPFILFVKDFYQKNSMSKKTRVTEDDFIVYIYFYFQSLIMYTLFHLTDRKQEECSYKVGSVTWMYEGPVPGWSLMLPIPMELIDMMLRSFGAGVKDKMCVRFMPTLMLQGYSFIEWYHAITFNEQDYVEKNITVVGRGQGANQIVDLPQCGYIVSHQSHQNILDLLFKGSTLMKDVLDEKGYWYLPKGLFTYCVILAEELKKMKWNMVEFRMIERCYNQRFPLVLHENMTDKQSKVGIAQEHWPKFVELCKMSKFDISGCSATKEDPAGLAGGYLAEA